MANEGIGGFFTFTSLGTWLGPEEGLLQFYLF